MRDLSGTPDAFLLPIARVVESMLAHTSALLSDDVMVVGSAKQTPPIAKVTSYVASTP
jgi:hypothetical protein